jgi:hypothetical protein
MSNKYVARFIGGPLCGHEEWTEQVRWPRTVPRCEPGRGQEYGLHLYATGTDSDTQWSDDGAFLLYYEGFSPVAHNFSRP